MESTESFYSGQDTPFSPEYHSPMLPNTYFSDLGTSQDARTANQLKETSKHLNTGMRTFEVAGHSPEVFDAMPQDHMKEINRMAKLTGTEATMHAPMIDPTGITQHGWDQLNQETAERQLWSAIERSHDLDPEGNINVTMHASTVGLPSPEQKVKEKGEEKTKSVILIDTQGKNLKQIRETERYFPEEGGKVEEQKFEPKKEIEKINKETWDEQLYNITYYLDIAKDRMGNAEIAKLAKLSGEKEETSHPEMEKITERAQRGVEHGSIYLRRSYTQLKGLFDLAWKGANEEDRKKLQSFVDKVTPLAQNLNKVEQNPDEIEKFADILNEGINTFRGIDTKIFVPLKEYATEKSAETISNLAIRSYEKFKNTAPIIAVENHPAGQSLLTTGEDLANVIKQARKKFEDDAVAKKIMSRSEAKKQAEKLIGATWDVGHINMMRKYGYDEEDILEETKKVAPFVKKVHLSDNFGFEHTELPMGMGNVPIQKIMARLGKEGFKGKKIVEALSWWQHFSEQGRQHALIPTLQGFNSPIYGMTNAPYWNQAIGTTGSYQGYPMAYMPEKHFSMYGSGFASLPEELGGQMPGTQSRFSGTANA